MKKLLMCVLALILIGCAALAEITNLHDLQNEIYYHSPRELSENPVRASIKGRIISIEFVKGNHYNMILQVDDPMATTPLGADGPQVIGHFRLHLDSLDEAPFAVGDEALIVGELNALYSSHIVPFIQIDEINGYEYDEF